MGRFNGDLPDRTHQFALSVMKLIDRLPSGTKGWIIGRQLVRSGTSVGANTSEADCALTSREFVQFCNIARREAAETRYWLTLCKDSGLLSGHEVDVCVTEADELVRVMSSVIRNTKESIAHSQPE